MKSSWKKAFVAATISIGVGLALAIVGFFLSGANIYQMGVNIDFDPDYAIGPEDWPEPPAPPTPPTPPTPPSFG